MEVRNTINGMKTTLKGMNTTLDDFDTGKISDLEDRIIEINQQEKQKTRTLLMWIVYRIQ